MEDYNNQDWFKELTTELNTFDDSGMTDALLSQWNAGKNSRPSESGKKKLSEMRRNQNFTSEHKEALKKGKLRYKISKEQIIEAQSKFYFGKDIANYLNISFNTYKSIAEYHKVYKTLGENNMGRINALAFANQLLVWKWDKKTQSKGEFVGEYVSGTEANNALGTTGAALSKVARGECKQAKGYYAEFKNK